MDLSRTIESSWTGKGAQNSVPPKAATPGLVLIFSEKDPFSIIFPLEQGAVKLGRGMTSGDFTLKDARMSRDHAEVEHDGARWTIRDLGSRNGTAVDGEELKGARTGEALTILRTGASIFLLTEDTQRFQNGVLSRGEAVLGPSLINVWEKIRRTAQNGSILHITGESGTGKELAAKAFHENGPRRGARFVAVSGPNITETLAESTLFGTSKGAFTGAVNTAGYIRSAAGGTLFIDEIGDLSITLQAKLLRVLETKQVTAVGATQPNSVDFSLCTATNKDLRTEVAAGHMRQDFFFRVGEPSVKLPPLRKRLEEIPFLIRRALAALSTQRPPGMREGKSLSGKALPYIPHVSLVEECLLRPWTGNVRELLSTVQDAAQESLWEGAASVQAKHLSSVAGRALNLSQPADVPAVASLAISSAKVFARAPEPAKTALRGATVAREPGRSSSHRKTDPAKVRQDAGPSTSSKIPPGRKAVPVSALSDAEIKEALWRANNNVSAASRALLVNRNQLRRWIAAHPLDGLATSSIELTGADTKNVSSDDAHD